ncbi:porin [Halomonas sp. LS-001]
MFKKRTLALATAGLLGASAAQAAVVYDQDGTSLDIYGRIAMGVEGGGVEAGTDNSEEFRNFGSRLRVTGSQQISSDLRAFARVEWRFTGDERNQSSGFDEVRNSYLGLESQQFGTVMAGNYDSFYDGYVMSPFDVYVERGYEFAGGGTQSRGDSIGYKTPDMNGFQVVLSGKHYSVRGLPEDQAPGDGNVIALQGGAVYATGPVRLALGFVDDKARGGGNEEVRYGTTATFDVSDEFSVRLGYETRDDNDLRGGGFDRTGLGASVGLDAWTFHADVYDIDPEGSADSRTAFAAAAHYDVTGDFDVFLEINDADEDSLSDVNEDLYYALGARYHF